MNVPTGQTPPNRHPKKAPPPNGGLILGIDLGSTSFKADVFDAALRPVGRGAAPLAYAGDAGERVELPVGAAEAAFRDAVSAAIDSAGCNGAGLAAVAVSSQAQTFTLLGADGRTKIPFVSWRDTRTTDDNPARHLRFLGLHCSVGAMMPGLTVSKLAHLQHTGKTPVCSPGDRLFWLTTWFVQALTGQAVVDANLAAMSGLYSLPLKTWWADALACCRISPRQLPMLAPLGTRAGLTTNAAQRLGIPAGLPVVLAGNDQTAGAYGAAIHERNALLMSLGTAQVVYACLDALPEPVPELMRGPYPGGRFYQLGADDCGSGTVNWVRTRLTGCTREKDFDAAAASAPVDCHGVRFIADGPAGTGRWTGLDHPDATPADQARAVLVTLVSRMARRIARLAPPARGRPLLLCGGGAASAPWREELKRQLGVDVTRINDAEPTRGAARMARDLLNAQTHPPTPNTPRHHEDI